jgi:hypothetical protein
MKSARFLVAGDVFSDVQGGEFEEPERPVGA